jgi:hypothetical protein
MNECNEIWSVYEQAAPASPSNAQTKQPADDASLTRKAIDTARDADTAASIAGYGKAAYKAAKGVYNKNFPAVANVAKKAFAIPMAPMAKKAIPLAKQMLPLAKVGLNTAARYIDPILTAADYAYDPKAFETNMYAKNKEAMDSLQQGKVGKYLANNFRDAALSPSETVLLC